MSETTYPRAQSLQVRYSAVEDRLVLIGATPGHGARIVLVPRRGVITVLRALTRTMKRTHPAADEAPADNLVLQLEHMAALSQTEEVPDEDGSADETAREPTAVQGDAPGQFLLYGCRVEPRGKRLLVALTGFRRDPLGSDGSEAVPAFALEMSRSQAHQLVDLLRDQAAKADWGIDQVVPWVDTMDFGQST